MKRGAVSQISFQAISEVAVRVPSTKQVLKALCVFFFNFYLIF